VEQAMQKSKPWLGARIAARIDDFAAAARCTSGFATASGFDVTASVTSTLVTQLVKQTKRTRVGASGSHCNYQESWNDYTTHRDISKELGFWEGLCHA
jgi:hypothetical protein